MAIKDVQALKKELLELAVELKGFKGEILAARVTQLEQTIHRPASISRKGPCDAGPVLLPIQGISLAKPTFTNGRFRFE